MKKANLDIALLALAAVLSAAACSSKRAPSISVAKDGEGLLASFHKEPILSIGVPALDEAGPAARRPEVAVSPAGAGWFRVEFVWNLPAEVRKDELSILVRSLRKPDFMWAPHLAPDDGYVIAQHVFRAPALISRQGKLVVSVVPDLDLVGRAAENPWFMDFDARSGESRIGLAPTEIPVHVLFKKIPGMTLAAGRVELAFFIEAHEDEDPLGNPWAAASRFLWRRWAKPLFDAGEPVRAPLDAYIRRTYDWAFSSWGDSVWQEFDLDGRRVGAPQFIVNVSQSPNHPGPWFQREFLSVWNQAWFSSLRSASGLYRYARRAGRDDLLAKARLAKELALAAPQRDGLFPSVIRTDNVEVEVGGRKLARPKSWATAYWTNSDRCPAEAGITTDWYHVLDASWTARQMLDWYKDLEPDPRLLDYARRYAERLLRLQDKAGFFPGWLHPETQAPGPIMNRTPETSVSAMFLLMLAGLTGDERFRASGLQAVDAVLADVVPEGRWEDFETYWSCCAWGRDGLVGRKVERNAMHKQNTLGMFWTAEALLAAFRATGEKRYLAAGRRVLDELSMAQQVWQPPFIHVPSLGGFGVMNADGEWNDSRETLFAELFLDYYRETGEPDLVERGTAALRSGFVMMYCPENPIVKSMWEKVYPWFGPADYGFTMENYGHGGRTSAAGEGMGVFTIYDWGNGAAAEAANRVLDRYGQAFVDRRRGRAFGIDAVSMSPRRGGGWDVEDRAGGRTAVRIVFEDGTSRDVPLEAGRGFIR